MENTLTDLLNNIKMSHCKGSNSNTSLCSPLPMPQAPWDDVTLDFVLSLVLKKEGFDHGGIDFLKRHILYHVTRLIM